MNGNAPCFMYGIDLGVGDDTRNPDDYHAEAIATTPDFDGFVVGDIVTLVTGSPDFVVVDTCECGSVDVVWYDDGGFNEASLPEEALTYA